MLGLNTRSIRVISANASRGIGGPTGEDAYFVAAGKLAQNTTQAQIKMALTRLGEDSHMVVTGDPSQSDLPGGVGLGLNEALSFLEGVEGVGVTRFTEKDVVRHPLVARIVAAYSRHGKS